MAGSLYIWFIGGFFLVAFLVAAGFALVLWLGHRLEKTETGSSHGFLEMPENQRGRPAKSSAEIPPTPRQN